jgi:hypothetical protein
MDENELVVQSKKQQTHRKHVSHNGLDGQAVEQDQKMFLIVVISVIVLVPLRFIVTFSLLGRVSL